MRNSRVHGCTRCDSGMSSVGLDRRLDAVAFLDVRDLVSDDHGELVVRLDEVDQSVVVVGIPPAAIAPMVSSSSSTEDVARERVGHRRVSCEPWPTIHHVPSGSSAGRAGAALRM